jgi:multidrug efflux pump
VHLRLKSDSWEDLLAATEIVRARYEATPGLTGIEDTRPLPGIDWQIDVDVERAGRFGADVATVGAMVQLVTRGVLLDTMRVESSDEEIEIRVRLPERDRVLSTLDTLKVRTPDGLVPLVELHHGPPVAKLAQIDRVDQKRFFDVKAGVAPNLVRITPADGGAPTLAPISQTTDDPALAARIARGEVTVTPVNPNERIGVLTEWLQSERPLPAGWTGNGPATRRTRPKARRS